MGVGSFQQFLQFADNPHLSFVQKQGVISLMIIGFYCFGLVVAILIGMMGLWRLRMIQLMPSSYKVIDLLTLAESKRREQASARVKGQPINRTAGIVFFILGVTIFAVIGPPDVFHPLPAFASFGAFLALIKSRQNFQVSADSLLAADQRQPILFLRAFVDDPRLVVRPTLEQVVKLVDFSVETRLANHFMDFGPFIAVGSPREKVPVPGAARVQLSDEHWQQWVTERIRASAVVVMYAGVTHWVGWELTQVVEADMTGKLVLLFPSPVAPKGRKSVKKKLAELLKEDLTNRLGRVRTTFAGTRWQVAWERVGDPETLIAARLDGAGGITLFRSKRRNNDAFQIAVEIAHLLILEV
jgi:hypothetical protein